MVMHRFLTALMAAEVCFSSLALSPVSAAMTVGSNLVVNGSFDNPTEALYGWKYKYDREGESWYFNNHLSVSVIDDGTRKRVLALKGDQATLQAPGQGVKVDSTPIPFEKGCSYEIAAWGRSSGPTSRVLVEGYKWAPGVKPHPNPELHELRKCYKFSQLYFSSKQDGGMGDVNRNWTRASSVIPDPVMSKSEAARKNLAMIKFLVIHVVAIGGSDGTLYIDDVSVKKLAK